MTRARPTPSAIHAFVRSSVSDRITVADVREAVPSARDEYISQVLRELRRDGVIELVKKGRAAEWRRLRADV